MITTTKPTKFNRGDIAGRITALWGWDQTGFWAPRKKWHWEVLEYDGSSWHLFIWDLCSIAEGKTKTRSEAEEKVRAEIERTEQAMTAEKRREAQTVWFYSVKDQ